MYPLSVALESPYLPSDSSVESTPYCQVRSKIKLDSPIPPPLRVPHALPQGMVGSSQSPASSPLDDQARLSLVRNLAVELDNNADVLESVERRQHEARVVIDTFRSTEFGGSCYGELHEDGYVVFPVLPSGKGSAERAMTREAMTERIEHEFVKYGEDGKRVLRTGR